jgi:hypothetical protein
MADTDGKNETDEVEEETGRLARTEPPGSSTDYEPLGPHIMRADQILTPEEAAAKRPEYVWPTEHTVKLVTEAEREESARRLGFKLMRCDHCGSVVAQQNQEGLSDLDLDLLAQLTERASKLLKDPHPGLVTWGMMTSETLNSIGLILKRGGI